MDCGGEGRYVGKRVVIQRKIILQNPTYRSILSQNAVNYVKILFKTYFVANL